MMIGFIVRSPGRMRTIAAANREADPLADFHRQRVRRVDRQRRAASRPRSVSRCRSPTKLTRLDLAASARRLAAATRRIASGRTIATASAVPECAGSTASRRPAAAASRSPPAPRQMLAAPMNSATKRLAGAEVDVARRADLRDRALAHHHDAVAERHRLGLIVGDVDRGDAERAQQRSSSTRSRSRSAASSAVSGSSSSSTRGRTATARASATRWRWPPESWSMLALLQALDAGQAPPARRRARLPLGRGTPRIFRP